MIPNIVAGPVRLLRQVLRIRPWWHASGIGWALYLNNEPTEFFKNLADALQAARALEP